MQTKKNPPGDLAEAEVLRSVERRVLWLATSVVHHANRVRPSRSGRGPLGESRGRVSSPYRRRRRVGRGGSGRVRPPG